MSEALASTWAYWSSGGILLLPLALVCFGIAACFLRLRGHLARLLRESRPLVEDLAALTPGCGLDSARSVVEQRGGGFALLLRHAIDAAGRGDDPACCCHAARSRSACCCAATCLRWPPSPASPHCWACSAR